LQAPGSHDGDDDQALRAAYVDDGPTGGRPRLNQRRTDHEEKASGEEGVGRDLDPLLWHVSVGLVTAALAAALLLIAALALGWNDPRPRRAPDWEDPAQPRRLAAAPNETAVSLLGQSASDFTLEVIARPLAGPESGFFGYGLAYRAQDSTHYYAFAVGGDGYYAILRSDGSDDVPLVTWQQFPHIQRGRGQNRLRVTCAGASCDFTINDEFAATVEDDTWLTGDVGLWARGFDDEVAVQFRGARLWTSDD
jgi:hypothetical protein